MYEALRCNTKFLKNSIDSGAEVRLAEDKITSALVIEMTKGSKTRRRRQVKNLCRRLTRKRQDNKTRGNFVIEC